MKRVPSPLALLIPVALACFALSPAAGALNPPPDGNYPNFTTAEGQNALQSLTTGVANTALGAYPLFGNIIGNYNTAVGAGALDLNTADSNTAIGTAALLLNTMGTLNTAVGTAALELNGIGSYNTAIGANALFNNAGSGPGFATGSKEFGRWRIGAF